MNRYELEAKALYDAGRYQELIDYAGHPPCACLGPKNGEPHCPCKMREKAVFDHYAWVKLRKLAAAERAGA